MEAAGEGLAGPCYRGSLLPPGVDMHEICANFTQGIVDIRLLETKASRRKKIAIKSK